MNILIAALRGAATAGYTLLVAPDLTGIKLLAAFFCLNILIVPFADHIRDRR